MREILIHNPETQEEMIVQEEIGGLSIFQIGEMVGQKYPNFLIKDIWQ